ncbi:dihydrouridine synthase protein [Cystoisospora suis]|uniref:Dihydrouridine synthase protein n=1 Tax=Cystoisospora suis TaxID=483139 RepID=A0A2C6KDZ3_9APIC|nr:dihydrouridine synthase protein [Cystoisospora suis]
MSAEGILDNPSLFSPVLLTYPSSSSFTHQRSPPFFRYHYFDALRSVFFSSFSRPSPSSPSSFSVLTMKSTFSSLYGLNLFSHVAMEPDHVSRCCMMEEYLDLCAIYAPPHPSYMKTHLFRCLYPILSQQTDLRERLGKVRYKKEKKKRGAKLVLSFSLSCSLCRTSLFLVNLFLLIYSHFSPPASLLDFLPSLLLFPSDSFTKTLHSFILSLHLVYLLPYPFIYLSLYRSRFLRAGKSPYI